MQLTVPEAKLVRARHTAAPDLPDPLAALAHALEHPFHYPPLRQALTPDDRITVVIDDALPGFARLLGPILEHIAGAGVEPQAITLLCPPDADTSWRLELPALFRRVTIEVHDPANAKGLCYLATTKEGQRLYLNRTLVEADQLVVLSGRRYDARLGYAGAETTIYPTFGDEESRRQTPKVRALPPGAEPPPLVATAREVAWLLGAPFFVQVIEGAGTGVAGYVTGTHEATAEGRRQQDARWLLPVPGAVNLVVATTGTTFLDLATAAARAARVVGTQGAVVIHMETAPDLGKVGEFLRECEDAEDALRRLGRQPTADQLAAWLWVTAAIQARLYLLGPLDEDAVERLFATQLDDAAQVGRLSDRAARVLLLPDAHKALPVLEE